MSGRAVQQNKALVTQLCLVVLQRINKCFLKCATIVQVIVLPQWTKYDRRVFLIFMLQVATSDYMALTILKTLQYNYKNNNLLLILSLGSILPFFRCVYNLWKHIPCPSMAAVCSNVGLLGTFIMLLVLGLSNFSASAWIIYTFIMSVWPWQILCSIVARLFIDKTLNKMPFSPVKELPVLGLLGAFAQVLMLMAVKHLNIADVVVLTFADPILQAGVAAALLGNARIKLHGRQFKLYFLIAALCMSYTWGDVGPGELQVTAPGKNHVLFLVARLFLVMRSVIVKRAYAKFSHSMIPDAPPEDIMIFFNTKEPRMHRFQQFPAPVLHTLDAIFDSGLADIDLHGMGPMGTKDLYMLTEQSYLLPIATMMAWLNEFDDLKYGFLPPSLFDETGAGQSSASYAKSVAATSADEVKATSLDIVLAIVLLMAFCATRFFAPHGAEKSLFDRASSSHSWKYRPLLLALPFFAFDALHLNENISKFQLIVAGIAASTVAFYRNILWNHFKRKHCLLSTQKLHYRHPSVLRTLQKRTLLEFAHSTAIEDYGVLLLETTIMNGNNVRDISRGMGLVVWDPTPTATAAWKLAFSLVTKSLRKQKQVIQLKRKAKKDTEEYIKKLLVELAYKAVDLADGHGGRLVLAKSLAGVVAKRCAIRKLHRNAERHRTLRQRRKMGQLAAVPMTLSVAGGAFRSIHEMTTLDSTGKLPVMTSQMPALPAPPTAAAGVVAQTHMSLTSSADNMLALPGGSMGGGNSTAGSPGPRLPNAITQNESGGSLMDRDDSKMRGLWYASSVDLNEAGGSPVASVVLSCGDMKCGQIGLSKEDVAKKGNASVHVIEELRGTMPAQIEAAGAASYVVTAEGKVYAFGSNRAMELGMRKDVTQVTTPMMMKSVRQQKIVQVVGSPSATGQAHTIALTAEGEVLTFGTSSCGALGQGNVVRQTAPLMMRFTQEVRIRYVAAGARHSLMVADSGKLYSFGDNSCGQLGTDMLDSQKRSLKYADTPVAVGGPLFEVPIIRLAVGDDHNLAVTQENHVYSWGAGNNGQLGIGRTDNQSRPVRIKELEHQGVHEVSSVACGSRHSLVVASEGAEPGSSRLFVFGSNASGQLGIGQSGAAEGHIRPVPQLCRTISNIRNMRIVQIVAASCHSLALAQDGKVYSFGDNAFGQLGFPPEGATDYNSAHAARRTAPAAFAASSSAFNLTAQVQSRKPTEIDAPLAFANGVARLWMPTRIVGLSLYKVKTIATADTHTLALAS